MGVKGPGRRPKPIAVKRAEGNRGKRALNKREPKPAGGAKKTSSALDAIMFDQGDGDVVN
jgi:hypothetical protein